jgi:NAD(P)-dependent dehydrogenase (short-subunit alcohol dehydrogenase family)
MSCFAKDMLSEMHVAISGGAGVLGLAIVKGLTEHGARVSINDVVENARAEDAFAKAQIPAERVQYIRGDLSKTEDAKRFVRGARDKFGAIHTALCHAGVVVPGPLLEVTEEGWDKTLDSNLKSAFLLGSEAAKSMLEDGVKGHLIFTTSWVSETPWPGIAPYIASKAGMHQLMRSFARELAEEGIRANAVAPGIVRAGMALRQWETEPDYRARAQKAIPLGKLQPVESVVDAFLFLCSEAASYMTGSVLVVDGGCSLYPMD